MKKNCPVEKINLKKCDLCTSPVSVNMYGGGHCEKCGWNQIQNPQVEQGKIHLPNFVSFDRARQLHRERKGLEPSFEEFLELLRIYGELEFDYKNTTFGVIRLDDRIEMFYDNNSRTLTTYKSLADFKARATIKNSLLKDIWYKVKKVRYM